MSLVARYRLDGNVEDSLGVHKLTPNASGTTYSADGIGGQCARTHQKWYNCGFVPSYLTSSISYSGWFYFQKSLIAANVAAATYTSSRTTPTGNLIGNGSYGGLGLHWYTNKIYKADGEQNELTTFYVMGYFRSPSATQNTGAVSVSFDAWHHIALVLNFITNKFELYVDGALAKSVNTSQRADIPVTNTVRLNWAAVYGGNGPGVYIDYYMSDIRIYNHPLSVKEIWDESKGIFAHYDWREDECEPTTNLGNTSATYSNMNKGQEYAASGWGGDTGTVTYYDEGGYDDLPYKVYHKKTTGTGGVYKKTADDIVIQANKTYTMSVYVKASVNITNASAYSFNINRGSDNNYINYGTSFNITTEWKRLTKTFTATSAQAGNYGEMSIIYDDNMADYYIYYSGFQIEENDHATPYTRSTRTGFLNDQTGNGHEPTSIVGVPKLVTDTSCPINNHYVNLRTGGIYYKFAAAAFTGIRKGSVAFWARFPDTTAKMIFGSTAGSYYFMAWNGSSGGGNWYNGSCSASTYYCDGEVYSQPKNDGQWHFYVATNVNFQSWGDYTYNLCCYNESAGNSFQFHGDLADMKIYSTTLSAADVNYLYRTAAIVDNKGTMYTNQFIEQSGDSSLTHNALKTSKLFTEVMTTPDGARWLPIMMHDVTQGVFSSIANLNNGFCYENTLKWANFSLIKNANLYENGIYEFLIMQEEGTDKVLHKYRIKQDLSPFAATWDDVKPAAVGTEFDSTHHVIRVDSSSTSYGGIYYRAGSEYFNFSNSSQSNWYGCGLTTYWGTGYIPGYNGAQIYGQQMLYLRIKDTWYQEFKNSITYTNELREEI